MTTRVGVVADSHVGEYLERLPNGVLDAVEGCDLVLHAGDICEISVLHQLRELAPAIAVHGDHDRGQARQLPRDRLITVAGRRLGLTHGRRHWAIEYSVVLSHLAAGRRLAYRGGLHRALAAYPRRPDRRGPRRDQHDQDRSTGPPHHPVHQRNTAQVL